MLPSGLLLYFEPVSLLFFQNKAIGGKRKQSGRVPFGSSLGAIGGGPAVEEEEGLLLKLIEITWSAWRKKAFKFSATSYPAVVQRSIHDQLQRNLTVVAAPSRLGDSMEPIVFHIITHSCPLGA